MVRCSEWCNPQPSGSIGVSTGGCTVGLLGTEKVPAGEIRSRISGRFDYDLDTPIEIIRASYVRTERAKDSVPQAINCALQASSFEDAIRSAVSIGGDSDTIAAIAGGIAEAMFGLPEDIAKQGWNYLPEDMQAVARSFYLGVI